MVQAIIGGYALVHVHRQHAVNEVQCQIRYRVPVGRWVVKAAEFDLLGKGVGVFRCIQLVAEWGEATEAYVKHNASRPDIDGFGVSSMVGGLEDLRGDVRWGAGQCSRE